jgi:hypothetical protein
MSHFLSKPSIVSDEASAKLFKCVARWGNPDEGFVGLGVATIPESDVACRLGSAKSATLQNMITKIYSSAAAMDFTDAVEHILQITKTSFLLANAESVDSREWKSNHLTASQEIYERLVWLRGDTWTVMIWFASGWTIEPPETSRQVSVRSRPSRVLIHTWLTLSLVYFSSRTPWFGNQEVDGNLASLLCWLDCDPARGRARLGRKHIM